MSDPEPASPPRLPPRKSAGPLINAVIDTPPPLPSRKGRRDVSPGPISPSTAIDSVEPLTNLGPAVTGAQAVIEDDTDDIPPPVPSRVGRRSISASPSPSPSQILDGTDETSLTSVPPPLPPRSAPSPIETSGPSTPRLEVTPATPPYPLSPVTVTTTSFGQMGDEIRGSFVPVTAHPMSNEPVTSTSLPEKLKEAVVDAKPFEFTSLSAIPPVDQVIAKFALAPVEALVIGALLLNLFLGRLSIFWVLLIGGGYAVYKQLQIQGKANTSGSGSNPFMPPTEGREALHWVNHALYALFPLISTDVLTPFIDLLEDALTTQVPPVVTSVRLTSAALGAQPMLLNSLRPMSDSEWFASLAPVNKRSKQETSTEPKVPLSTKKAHQRTTSTSSRLSRSASSESNLSTLNPDEVAYEADKRRKRDRILQKVSRRQRHLSSPSSSSAAYSSGRGNLGSSPHYDGPLDNGEDTQADHAMEGAEEDDPNAGQYVNYQVGFEYKRTETTKKKGWGLHVLAYFGLGVKGVGKTEIPVYIDVLGIKGTINVRLLLSATPPFVRTATFSFPSLPDFDISATPLRRGAFNAMELPGMKWYVQKSIAAVAKTFVRPESYSIDVDRLLLGRESALRTQTVGVLQIIIHSASDLPKTDTMGACDPYVMICMTKFRKPVFSTRTIINTQSPSWEEEAFILISADAIESGERLRVRLVDSDRFSSDDSMGVVEVEIPELVEQGESLPSDQPPIRRIDRLTPERSGMRTSGQLEWSVRFFPLWTMSQEELEKRVKDRIQMRPGEPTEADMSLPSWLQWINNYMDVPDWAEERKQRRQETIAWFTGEREREEVEAAAAPHDELRSGILQFHIHQCVDLETDSSDGTYSSRMNHRLSAAGGKPALSEITDRTPAENPEPPSAYCEVHLNDRFVYRTRTKQVTPLPYFNAVSERFIRDWRMAKIVFVIRDERDREHDPILGLVTLYLKDVLSEHSHFTRWFPLSAGLGWGQVRISLLFKPVDICLPPRVSGYEVATLEVKSLAATDLSNMTDRNISVMIETEHDRYTLKTAEDDDSAKAGSVEAFSPGDVSAGSSLDLNGDATQVEWTIDRPIKLAVEYRHSCSIVVSFITKSKVVKKKKVLGLATIRLDDCPDGETCERTVPIFETTEVKDAMSGTAVWFDQDAPGSAKASPSPSRRHSGASSRRRSMGGSARIIGYVTLSLLLHPGMSRAHSKLCKKDLRLAKVYEAWEAYRDVVIRRAKTRENKLVWTENIVDSGIAETGSGEVELEDSNPLSDDDDASSFGAELRRTTSERELYDVEEKKGGLFAEKRAHSKALHKKHQGIFQLKVVRTGAFVKDKLEAKFRSSNNQRRRGGDLDVEREGQSSL